MTTRRWDGTDMDEWQKQSDLVWQEYMNGLRTFTLAEDSFRIKTEYGDFVEIQRSASLDEEPDVLIRTSHYGRALKMLIPTDAKPGNRLRIVRWSQSGKSVIAEIVR